MPLSGSECGGSGVLQGPGLERQSLSGALSTCYEGESKLRHLLTSGFL